MPEFQFQEMFPSGEDTTPYRKLSSDFVGTTKFNGRDVLTVEPEALTLLTAAGLQGHLPPAAAGPSRRSCARSSTTARPRPTTSTWRSSS